MNSKQQTDMRRTWLIQRLEKPRNSIGPFGAGNPFAFGGGLKNGGLTDEAMGTLRDIFSFDYMGAAEFEFGAVPEALQGMAKNHKRLSPFTMTIALKDVQKGWDDKSATDPTGEATVYVLARMGHVTEVEARIRAMAAKDHEFKESTHLSAVLRPTPGARWTPETVGWLELDNGFMFFVDRDMWAKACDLFGIEVSADVSV